MTPRALIDELQVEIYTLRDQLSTAILMRFAAERQLEAAEVDYQRRLAGIQRGKVAERTRRARGTVKRRGKVAA